VLHPKPNQGERRFLKRKILSGAKALLVAGTLFQFNKELRLSSPESRAGSFTWSAEEKPVRI